MLSVERIRFVAITGLLVGMVVFLIGAHGGTSGSAVASAERGQVTASPASAYGVLRRPSSTEDHLPDALAAPALGLRVAEARFAFMTARGGPSFVVPTDAGHVCLVGNLAGGMCVDRPKTEPSFGTATCGPYVPDGITEIYGLAPDGVSSLRINGTLVEIVNNAFVTESSSASRNASASWMVGDVRESATLPSGDPSIICAAPAG